MLCGSLPTTRKRVETDGGERNDDQFIIGRETPTHSACGLIGVLLRALLFGGYVANSHGQPIPGEFLAIWSAGQMAAWGHASDAYDIQLLHQLQVHDTGIPFGGYFMWLFPPPFFLIAALLAHLLAIFRSKAAAIKYSG